jgi:IS4 transposase
LKGNLPQTVFVTPARCHDVNILDRLSFEPGAIYIFDRAYLDFVRLHLIHRAPAFFITRARRNFRFRRLYSRAVEPTSGVICDQTIRLKSFYPLRGYPDQLRRIRYGDLQHSHRLVFLTNNFLLPAAQIARLYQCRWQIELFFKWIKQHLRIKAFFGISENAVKTQIWIAICVYVLVAIIKKHLRVDTKPYEILQVLSVSLFEKMPILQAFSRNSPALEEADFSNQLKLFDL